MSDNFLTRRRLLAAGAALGAGSALNGAALAQPAPVQPVPASSGRPRVRLETVMGAIVLELAAGKAPVTAANLLRYVDARRFDGTAFFRAVNAPGAPEVGFVQAGIREAKKLYPPIAHESTALTGLKHLDGTVSMGRLEPGTARADFTICCGAAPHMDANPAAPGDNAGYAAFGQVVEGMEIVRAILAAPRGGPAPIPSMAGQILDPPVRIINARRV